MVYSEKLKDPRWQKKRLLTLDRDNWKCCKCGDSEQVLHVHHLEYTGEPWDAPQQSLMTLCADCHSVIEAVSVKGHNFNTIKLKNPNRYNIVILLYNNNVYFYKPMYGHPELLLVFNHNGDTQKRIFDFINS